MTALTPARLLFDHGVPRSVDFDDVYHSADGAVAQAETVFLGGNGLPERWQDGGSFQILETGFGLGLNFLVTWHHWQNLGVNLGVRPPLGSDPALNPALNPVLHFVSFEKHPLTHNDLAQALAPFIQLAPLAQQLLAVWPPLVSGYHRLEFDQGQVVLTLILGDIQKTLPQLRMAADAIYLDGFSPDKNPHMWNAPLFHNLARQCLPTTTLATWTVAGHVRRALEAEGFTVSREAGFGQKRERLVALFNKIPAAAFTHMATPARNAVVAHHVNPTRNTRHALVVGAGLAGCLTAEALSRRGWRVDLLDAHSGPAQEASGNPAGILRPMLSQDDNRASRLSRAAFLHAARLLQRLNRTGILQYKLCGVLHLAEDAEQETLQRAAIDHQGVAPLYAQFLERSEASACAGIKTEHGGWYFPQAGWVNPISLCQAALRAAEDRVQSHWNSPIAGLHREGGHWHATNSESAVLAKAPVVILATGSHVLPQAAHLPLESIRGQITQLGSDPFAPGTPVLCLSGYVISGLPSGICIGATYDNDTNPMPTLSSEQENLARLKRLLPDLADLGSDPKSGSEPKSTKSGPKGARVGFRAVSQDRMPIVGGLPTHEGLYTLMGLGSRGLVLGGLCAELIAAQLNGEPLPLEIELVEALSSQRFSKC